MGVILTTAEYTTKYGVTIPTPKRPAIYDATITKDTVSFERAKKEITWKVKSAHYDVKHIAIRCARKFIIAVVEDTWICELRDLILRYNDAAPRAIMLHLTTTCLGIHTLDVLTLPNAMQKYHTEYDSILTYINVLEDAQKQSGRAGNTVIDAQLLLIATTVMLSTQRFPSANYKWEDKDPADKTWEEWKTHFKSAEKRLMYPELPWEPNLNSEQRMEQACLPRPMRHILLKQRHWKNTLTRLPLRPPRIKKSWRTWSAQTLCSPRATQSSWRQPSS